RFLVAQAERDAVRVAGRFPLAHGDGDEHQGDRDGREQQTTAEHRSGPQSGSPITVGADTDLGGIRSSNDWKGNGAQIYGQLAATAPARWRGRTLQRWHVDFVCVWPTSLDRTPIAAAASELARPRPFDRLLQDERSRPREVRTESVALGSVTLLHCGG